MSRWPLTPRGTGAALLAIACFIGAQAFTITELLYVGALLAIVLVAALASLHLSRGRDRAARRTDPDVAAVSRQVEVRVRVESRGALPGAPGRWRDTLPEGIEADAQGEFPQTGSGGWSGRREVEIGYVATARRRGIRDIGPLAVTVTDPFGFARRTRTIGRPLALTVTPPVIELRPLAEQPGAAGGSMHSATDQLGQGSDNLTPRHYIPGDSMRRIHWRASAHRDELMVRQEEQETTPEAFVVFDRGAARWDAGASRAPGGDPAFEAAVTACLSTTARLVHEGYVVEVLDLDGELLAGPIDGGDQAGIAELAIDLARVTARRDGALEQLVPLFTGGIAGPIVLITGAVGGAEARIIAPLAHHTTLPLLLAAGGDEASLEVLQDAGWHLARIGGDRDLADAWSDLIDRGVARVGA